MKKQYLTIAAIAMSLTAYAENKFDARGEIIVGQYNQFMKDPGKMLLQTDELPLNLDVVSRSGSTASVAVILADGVSRSQIEDLGFSVNAATRSVLLIEGKMDDIIALADTDLVKSVSFADEYDQLLDYGRRFTGVDVIHTGGDGLPQAYTGKGVITGIFDSGIYPDHINFKNEDGSCRISNFWHYTSSDGKKVTHYDTPEKVVKINGGTDTSTSSHGTHTLGCMAGFCYPNVKSMSIYDQRSDKADKWDVVNSLKYPKGKAVPFYGMAKESEILAAAGSLYDQNMMAGIQAMSDYIIKSGKPGVINLSVGSIIGPKDGTDAFTLFLDEIAENVTICIAAGNDGDSDYSLSGQSFKTFISTAADPTAGISGVIDLWGSDDKPYDATIVVFDTTTGKSLFSYDVNFNNRQAIIGNKAYQNVTVTDNSFEDAFSSSYLIVQPKKNTANNRYNAYIQYNLNNNKLTNAEGSVAIGIMVNCKDGQHVDLAHRATKGAGTISSLGIDGWSNGNSDITISSMACGHNTIAVGAWNSRNEWGIIPRSQWFYSRTPELYGLGLDDIAGYSSYGKLCDGRSKPDFTAPGTGIISSVSTPAKASLDDGTSPCATYSSGTRSDSWGIMQGTSMATPIVAGAIALWLEAEPTITTAEIREIALSTCSTDSYTQGGDPLRWGAGKFNALAGLHKVLDSAGINDITTDAGDKFQVTPTGESSWNIFVCGATKIDARLINIAGQTVSTVSAAGNEATVNASNLTPGIYVLNVNGVHSTRIAVR